MKTKETNPTRPGSPTPCKQALNRGCPLNTGFTVLIFSSFSVVQQNPVFWHVFKKARKRNDKVYFFWTEINSFNLKNEHYNSISRHKTFGGVSVLLFTFFGPFFIKLTITFSAILSLCRFGDHVLLFLGSTAMMLVFQASCSQISCDFFSPHRPTHPKPGNLFDAKQTKRG